MFIKTRFGTLTVTVGRNANRTRAFCIVVTRNRPAPRTALLTLSRGLCAVIVSDSVQGARVVWQRGGAA
jgi:hypothetical protein